MPRTAAPPRILVAAGLEPTGRMGLLADLATLRELRAEGIGVATAMTAQGERTFSVAATAPNVLRAQIAAAAEQGPIHGAKLGMIPNRRVLAAVWDALLEARPDWVVVDPVVRSSRGQTLSTLVPRDYLRLAASNVVLTPNLAEAAWLLGRPVPPSTVAEAAQLAAQLRKVGFGAVTIKGGHLRGGPVDVIDAGQGQLLLRGRKLRRTARQRGTGCRYASAMCVQLVRGKTVNAAAKLAKRHVENFLGAPILGAREHRER